MHGRPGAVCLLGQVLLLYQIMHLLRIQQGGGAEARMVKKQIINEGKGYRN